MVPETRVFTAADGEDLVILACTLFDWSTRVTDGQTGRQTELRWLRRAESSIAAFARKNQTNSTEDESGMDTGRVDPRVGSGRILSLIHISEPTRPY